MITYKYYELAGSHCFGNEAESVPVGSPDTKTVGLPADLSRL